MPSEMARSSYRRRLKQRRRLPTWRRSVDRDDIKVSSQPGLNTAAGPVGRASGGGGGGPILRLC